MSVKDRSFIRFFPSIEQADRWGLSYATWDGDRKYFRLMPNEIYTQFSKIFTTTEITDVDITVTKFGSEEIDSTDFCFGYQTSNQGNYQAFNFSFMIEKEFDNCCLRLVLDTNARTFYSNLFIVSLIHEENTTLVSYRHDENHYGIQYSDWPTIYNQIRLPIYYLTPKIEEDSEEYVVSRTTPTNVRQSRMIISEFDVYNTDGGAYVNPRLSTLASSDEVYFKNQRTRELIENSNLFENSLRHYPRPFVPDEIEAPADSAENTWDVQCSDDEFLSTDSFLPTYIDVALTNTENVSACTETGNITATFSGILPLFPVLRLRFTFSGTSSIITFNGTDYVSGETLVVDYDPFNNPLQIPYELMIDVDSSASVLVEVLDKDNNVLGGNLTLTHSCDDQATCIDPTLISVDVDGNLNALYVWSTNGYDYGAGTVLAQYSIDGGNTWVNVGTFNPVSGTLTVDLSGQPIIIGTPILYRVEAFGNGCSNMDSNVIDGGAFGVPDTCETPVINSVNIAANGRISIDYTVTTTDLSTPEIQIATDSGFTNVVFTALGFTYSNPYTLSDSQMNNIPDNTTLFIRVRKICSTTGTSDWSTTEQFTSGNWVNVDPTPDQFFNIVPPSVSNPTTGGTSICTTGNAYGKTLQLSTGSSLVIGVSQIELPDGTPAIPGNISSLDTIPGAPTYNNNGIRWIRLNSLESSLGTGATIYDVNPSTGIIIGISTTFSC